MFKLIDTRIIKLREEFFEPDEGWSNHSWHILAQVQMPLRSINNIVYPERLFVLLMNHRSGATGIEEWVGIENGGFIKITDESLWNDLYLFLVETKCLTYGKDIEKVINY